MLHQVHSAEPGVGPGVVVPGVATTTLAALKSALVTSDETANIAGRSVARFQPGL